MCGRESDDKLGLGLRHIYNRVCPVYPNEVWPQAGL